MIAHAAAVQTIGRIDAQIREWIARCASGSASGRLASLELGRLQTLLEDGKSLIAIVRGTGAPNAATNPELQSYAATLRELEPLIEQKEITLRMRRAQIDAARSRLMATAAWAGRVRQLG